VSNARAPGFLALALPPATPQIMQDSLQVRVRIDIPELLPELCDYLLRRGWAVVEVDLDEVNVLAHWAPSDFEAATMLLADVGLWRAQRPWTHVTVNPHVTG
jgi:hypothetical protein